MADAHRPPDRLFQQQLPGEEVPKARKTSALAIIVPIIGIVGIPLVLILLPILGILLPALSGARQAARQIKNTNQIRGINHGMTTYGAANHGYYPGLDSNGNPVDLTVENRIWTMLDSNLISSDYMISPNELKTTWQAGPLTSDNYSYTLLDISENGERRNEWRQTNNGMAITISDRNTGSSAASQDVMSVNTQSPGYWAGSVAYNDGHAAYETIHEQDVKYGSGPTYQSDNIFEAAGEDDAMMIYQGD